MDHVFNYKQVIVVRGDLTMSPAKMSVQVAHASIGAYRDAIEKIGMDNVNGWFNEGFRKIVLKAKDIEELLKIHAKCTENNLPCYIVYDFGLTELEPNTLTALGIGPDLNERIDKVSKRLHLWK